MINKILIRDQVRDFVSNQIIAGKYRPGTRIGLSGISRELNVSPTPVREALTQLQEKGMLVVEPNRGFFIPPVSLEMANNIYPILWTLECLAIDYTDRFDELQLRELEKINLQLKQPGTTPAQMVNLDDFWHQTLVRNCGNPLLLSKIDDLKMRATLFELFYMKDSSKTIISTDHHDKIIQRLTENRMDDVKNLMKEHWNLSLRFLTEWLSDIENK